jgi:hypothetical protein
MIGAVSICHYGFENARMNKFPTWTETAGVQVFAHCPYERFMGLWGYVKDKMFVPPQPVSIPDLQNRIEAAVATITPDLLIRVWQELDYRLDVCRVTKGAHIKYL